MNKNQTTLDHESFVGDYLRILTDNGMEKFATTELAEKFFTLTEYMLSQNAVMNLTAITDPCEIILKHYVDSLALAEHIAEGKSIIDVGCGAGFPSLVLALVRPDIGVCAIDSTEKRIIYVNECAKLLGINNISAYAIRAEDAANGVMREKYDYATARAVARLNILSEYCIPLLKVGGMFLPMKAKSGEEEMIEAKNAFVALRAKVAFSKQFSLKATNCEGEELTRFIAGIEKYGKTEKIYPRNNSIIKKKPL